MTDLGHKITLQNTILKTYDGTELIIYTAIINALILLPFILLFTPSGFLADKYPKPKIIKIASFSAIIITGLILLSYNLELFWLSFGLTFLLAIQSAIYSPAKYGLIKELTGNEKIAEANAIVQAVTIVSILLGAIVFSVIFEFLLPSGSFTKNEILSYMSPIAYTLIAFSTIEFLLALKLKETKQQTDTKFNIKEYKSGTYLRNNLNSLKSNNDVFLAVIGLSVLWGISQLILAVYGPFLKETLNITNTITIQGLLAMSGLGIIFGSLYAGKASKNYIELGTIPLGSIGLAITTILLPSATNLYLSGLYLFMYGFFAGLLIVPLNSIIQFNTKEEKLGTILAGNNFVQNIFMFSFLILTSMFAYMSLSSTALIYLASIIAIIGAGYTLCKIPQSLVRFFVKSIIGLRFKLSVSGLNNIEENKGILLLGNHISFLDWAILQMAYPKQISFVIDKTFYQKWYLNPFLKFFQAVPISPRGSKDALKTISELLSAGKTVALFPEGLISRNGQLSEFQKGFEIAAENATNSIIVPFYLRGLWETGFSRASKKMKDKKERNISVTFGKKIDINSKAETVKKAVLDLSIISWSNYADTLPSIQESWLETAKSNNYLAVADSTGVELSSNNFIVAVFLIASKLKKLLKKDQSIGLILPTSAAGLIGNMAVLSLGRTVVNINYSAGSKSVGYAMELADVNKVVTSKKFLTKLKAKGFDLDEVLSNKELIFLEDLKPTTSQKIRKSILVQLLPVYILKMFIKRNKSSDTAAILFSSGSEGQPKGIELTHKNIMGNIKQTQTVLNPDTDDIMLGTLPIFHSFGLTVTTLLPLTEGLTVISHPDPTDGFNIGKLAFKYKATILLGTATFLRLYTKNRKLQPLMFSSLRLVVAGAEKLPKEISAEFKNKFGLDIYEGYGATETTPVATINISDALAPDTWKVQKGNKPGTVGLPVPGSNIKIVDPDSFKELELGEAGMVLIGGTQIMKGYLKDPEKTNSVIKEINGIRWYVTGDKGQLDKDGFLTLVDRYSRFAKIGGEMVSLGLVEEHIRELTDLEILAVAIPDSKKGEKVVLLVAGNVDLLKDSVKSSSLNALFHPSIYLEVSEIPKLGTGKVDFKEGKKIALEK
jgi:acyl-[acyl-carrier-protein]-phospholipid O-acyltransferase/long-chain-fatty-acid--[acyl-carrier-protein] ligase